MRPTRVLDLVLNVIVAAALGWAVTRWAYSSFPAITMFAGASLLPVAAIETALGFVIKAKIADQHVGDGPHELHPINVARAAALAKASLQVGSIAAGAWLGFLLWAFPQRASVSAAEADIPGAVVGLLAGSALVAAALWLEFCCRAPEDPTDDSATT
ncbi:DUF3180 domain-containing protein [Nocardia camponoti]|uniref:DUF3180 domain-containing protein n=1 Tax=Nocardia camponoti TaxID=1616106 RepID=UPI001669427A|nr:DUF3180 domain-containing protein [Nocardia camponoti]